MQLTQEDTMNQIQSEQLFTDLTPGQAETIAAGLMRRPVDPVEDVSLANGSFGNASAQINSVGNNGFSVPSLFVKDGLRDGHAVYARFQAQATDGSKLITPTKRYDRKGKAGDGTLYRNLQGSFKKSISQVRVLVYNDVSGTDPVAAGNWVNV